MKPTVYLETTIVSYLTAWRSRDLVMAAQQQITEDWWNNRRADYDLYASQVVVQEASGGDPDAAKRRLEVLDQIPLLNVTPDARGFARQLMQDVPLPKRAEVDALHIAVAVVNGIHYLLSPYPVAVHNDLIPPLGQVLDRQQVAVPFVQHGNKAEVEREEQAVVEGHAGIQP